MRFSTSGYLLGETGKSIWRNKMSSFLSCATTALSLFLLGVAFLISLNLKFLVTQAQGQMEIQAYLNRQTTEAQSVSTVEAIKKLPGVSEVKYVSPDDALAWLKEVYQDDASVLEGLGDQNPLPACIQVKPADSAEIPTIVNEIKKIAAVEDVKYPVVASSRLPSIARASALLSLGGMLVVGLVAVMVIGNSIRLTIDARRHEIAIMKLVGATDEFIVGPFVLEGIVLGMIGGLLGEVVVVSLYRWVVGELQRTLPFIPVMKLGMRSALDMLGVVLVTGIAVGTVGSVTSLRRHLRV